MLPSRRFILMVLAASPLLLAGVFDSVFTGLGVIYLLFVVFYALVDILLLPRRGQFQIRRLMPEQISIGEPVRVRLFIRSQTRRPVEVNLAEQLDEDIASEPAVCTAVLGPRAEGELEYRLVIRRRGRYALNRIDVRLLPRMGLFYRQFTLSLPAWVKVVPNLVNIKRYELRLRKGVPFDYGRTRIRQGGQGYEFESMRFYTPGDDISRINWKTTAKRSRLVVKNFEPERQQSVLAVLDVGRATAGEFAGMSRLDYFINAALMLAYVSLRQGDWFSLVAFSDRIESYLPPVRHVGHIQRVTQALYELQPRLVESDYSSACRFLNLKHRKRSLLCLMTDVIDRQANDDIIGYLARFRRRHLPLCITLKDSELQTLAEGPLALCKDYAVRAAALDVLSAREEALQAMRHHGVLILNTEPKQLTPHLIDRYLDIKRRRQL
jgi:uncharacterized protein (DUF58 family)